MLSVKPEVHLSDQTVEVSSSGQFFCSELSVLIGKQQYLIGLPQILIDLYDCPEIKEVSTIKHGKWVLKNVFLNLLGGATTEGLQEAFPKEALTQGLLSRFLLIIMPETWDYRNPKPPRKNVETRLKLAQELEKISNLKGEMTWTHEADKLYCDWYMSRTITKDVGYFEREPDHVIKLCILLQIAENKKFEISQKTFQQAIDIAHILASDVTGYLPTLRAEPSGQRSARVLRKLIELGGSEQWIPHSTLMSKCWYFIPGRSMEFSEIIQFLKEINVIKSEAKEGTVLYKAIESDIWTKSQIKKETGK
jgi:hypothetical protein